MAANDLTTDHELAERLAYAVGDGDEQDVLGALAALLVAIHVREREAAERDHDHQEDTI